MTIQIVCEDVFFFLRVKNCTYGKGALI